MRIKSVKNFFYKVRIFVVLSKCRCHHRCDTQNPKDPEIVQSYKKMQKEGSRDPSGPVGRAVNGPRNRVKARTPTPALEKWFSCVAAHGTPFGGLEPPGAPDQHRGSPGPGPGLAGVPAAGEAESSRLGAERRRLDPRLPSLLSAGSSTEDTPGREEGHEGRGAPDLRRRVRPARPTTAGHTRPGW